MEHYYNGRVSLATVEIAPNSEYTMVKGLVPNREHGVYARNVCNGVVSGEVTLEAIVLDDVYEETVSTTSINNNAYYGIIKLENKTNNPVTFFCFCYPPELCVSKTTNVDPIRAKKGDVINLPTSGWVSILSGEAELVRITNNTTSIKVNEDCVIAYLGEGVEYYEAIDPVVFHGRSLRR